MLKKILLLCTLTLGSAFLPSSSFVRPRAPLKALMTEAEADKLMKQASACADGECSVGEVAEFMGGLRDQEKILRNRLDDITSLISSLTALNSAAGEDRNTDELRESIRSLARIFTASAKASGNDYPSLSFPMGYSGDVKGGSKTAFDNDMAKKK